LHKKLTAKYVVAIMFAMLAILPHPASRAQDIQIVARPLTTQEVTDLGLTNTTQIAGGNLTVGLGQPAYLEVQVEKDTVVTQVVWSVNSQPVGSTATLTASPIALAVPIYDGGQREDFDVAGRQMLRPDLVGPYTVSVLVQGTTNGVPVSLAATNEVMGGTYVGVNDMLCGVCHAADKTKWATTGHATFFTRSIDGLTSSHYGEGCISCHTVGFDTTAGAVNGGFDDVAATNGWEFPSTLASTNWDAMTSGLQNKANIQCENCHGPASQHKAAVGGAVGDRKISINLSSGNCGTCHDAMDHHVKNFEWNQSKHAVGDVFRSGSCDSCHSGNGFIKSIDPDYASKDVTATGAEGISCAACHDPHADEGPHQLRTVSDVTLGDGFTTITNAGLGSLCIQCHKSRRDAVDYVKEYHDHYGPHHGPQADMLVGANAIEYGKEIASSSSHTDMIEDTCVHCHMQEVIDTFPGKGPMYTNVLNNAGAHTFNMEWDAGTPEDPSDDVDLTGACAECHGASDTFDVGSHDFDGDGVIQGVQTEVGNLLDELAMLLPPVGSNTVVVTAAYASNELAAAYNYLFVEEDGSHGIHNPQYAAGLLRASIEDMGGTLEPPMVPEHEFVRIASRPLTTQDVTDHSLTNPAPAQLAGGLHTIALGAPAYLEAQALQIVPDTDPDVPLVVTQVVWSLVSQPAGSSSVLGADPLGAGVPMYDGGERASFNLAGRTVLVPDVPGEYLVTATLNGTTNGLPVSLLTGKKIVGATFQGWEACETCHDGSLNPDRITEWEETGHATFFTEMLTNGPVYYGQHCINCHTLGFDETAGADNGGFDDVAADLAWTFPSSKHPTNWTEMAASLQVKGNIQCENCHGPAGVHTFGGGIDSIDVSLSSGNCGQCHDAMTHHVKNYEWNQTLHATGDVYRASGSCSPCHSTIGFVNAIDPDYASKDVSGTGLEGVTCAACHDPHSDEGPHQLRVVTSAALKDGVTVITEGGTGLLCMQCHMSRRDAVEYVKAYGSHYGPHHGPQADMLAGANAIEYGMDIPRSKHLDSVEDSCVDCHMQAVVDTLPDQGPTYTNALNHVGEHTFSMKWNADTPGDEGDDLDLVGNCMGCHGPLDDFDFGGDDYDGDGTVEGVQSEIDDLLTSLAMLLPPVGSSEVTVTAGYSSNELAAAYNYLFVEEDGSHGVHNPKYAAGLLQASITSLTTGFDDLDGDGLTDIWEVLHFGRASTQNGQDDADGDGVLNSLEEALGTDPNKADTDNDGFTDLAEIQAGSDPLVMGDVPEAGFTRLYSALELVSVLMPGTNYQLQAISSMGNGGSWSNVGDVVVGSGQELQHFISVRSVTQQYYRVLEVNP